MDNYEKKILSGEEVIEEFDKIAVWHCQRYGVQGYDKEDIYQSCLLEIYQAYIEYDYTKEIKFSTFANSFVNLFKQLSSVLFVYFHAFLSNLSIHSIFSFIEKWSSR